MKKSRVVTLALGLCLYAQAGHAQGTAHLWNDPNAWLGNHFSYRMSDQMYTANEFSLDMFGSYTAAEEKFTHLAQKNIRDGTWGGGVGINYFLTREIGIGGDINIPANKGNFIDSINGSLIGRIPIGTSGLAPYVFGGGGRQTEPAWEWTGHAGAGLELRMNPVTGLFTDARYTWADKSSDSILLRGGVRFVF